MKQHISYKWGTNHRAFLIYSALCIGNKSYVISLPIIISLWYFIRLDAKVYVVQTLCNWHVNQKSLVFALNILCFITVIYCKPCDLWEVRSDSGISSQSSLQILYFYLAVPQFVMNTLKVRTKKFLKPFVSVINLQWMIATNLDILVYTNNLANKQSQRIKSDCYAMRSSHIFTCAKVAYRQIYKFWVRLEMAVDV